MKCLKDGYRGYMCLNGNPCESREVAMDEDGGADNGDVKCDYRDFCNRCELRGFPFPLGKGSSGTIYRHRNGESLEIFFPR